MDCYHYNCLRRCNNSQFYQSSAIIGKAKISIMCINISALKTIFNKQVLLLQALNPYQFKGKCTSPPPHIFGRSVNPISTREEDHALHISAALLQIFRPSAIPDYQPQCQQIKYKVSKMRGHGSQWFHIKKKMKTKVLKRN